MRGVLCLAAAALLVAGCAGPSATVAPTPSPTAEPPCACASFPPTQPPGAISRESAADAARRATPGASAATEVYWSEWYPSDPVAWPDGLATLAPPGVVWEVRHRGLEGSTSPDCGQPVHAGPGATPCLDESHSTIVVLDGRTGALLGWTQ